MKRGYVKLWRKSLDDPLFKEKRVFSRWESWIDMIMQASGTDRKVKNVNGEGVFLKRGQFMSSERELAARWNWSKGKTSRFMEKLKMGRGMGRRISVKVDHRYSQKMGQPKSIITITNYNKYNPVNNESGAPEKSKSGAAQKIESGATNGALFKEGKINKREELIKRGIRRRVEREKGETLDSDHKNFIKEVEFSLYESEPIPSKEED